MANQQAQLTLIYDTPTNAYNFMEADRYSHLSEADIQYLTTYKKLMEAI